MVGVTNPTTISRSLSEASWSVVIYRRHGKALFDERHTLSELDLRDLLHSKTGLKVERIEIIPAILAEQEGGA